MKKSKRMLFVVTALLVVAITLSVSFQTQHARVTGTWNMTVETSMGSGTPVFVLKQENDTLISGTYKGTFGEAPVRGTIKGNKIDMKFSASDMTMEYIGTVDGNSMKGKAVLGTVGEGTFTGTRSKQ